VLLAAAHLPSKLHWSGESQGFECVELVRQIVAEEQKAGHQRTILVGDLNMNPFEAGIVAGLNSVATRRIASRGTRTVQGREYRFFYNPMWGHFGDARSDTAGSYYYDAGAHVNHYWNLFDQVLLRPELAERFDPSHLSVVKSVGGISLVTADGRPEAAGISDHLPLVFEVEF
jgi:endonuclease/exonuclease/phosphatase family metal-dependent hydrolase